NLEEQLKLFDSDLVLGGTIETVEKLEDETFKLTAMNGNVHYSKVIIITDGKGAFEPRKRNMQDCQCFEGEYVHFFMKDMNKYQGQHVVVLGSGDSAVDWSLMLEPIAEKVTLIHRRNEFRAHEHTMEQLKASSVNILTPYVPTDLEGVNKVER